ncbi:unnamed protein product [Amoebophrya sp. A120]|nr:unnamed protein product [Amoebophrya sp. A120]|eukprot:GSA120T00017471001.1
MLVPEDVAPREENASVLLVKNTRSIRKCINDHEDIKLHMYSILCFQYMYNFYYFYNLHLLSARKSKKCFEIIEDCICMHMRFIDNRIAVFGAPVGSSLRISKPQLYLNTC